jgi:hypothetical protein
MMNTIGVLETLAQDFCHGARQIREDRGFASGMVLTLALGIGSVTVMYSVIHNVLLDPFPYSRSDRLIEVGHRPAGGT